MQRIKEFVAAFIVIYASVNSVADAALVSLMGGAADPYNMGYVPVPPNLPVPFTSTDIAAITDGNLATAHSFISRQGEYSSNPGSVTGFGVRFDFDISKYSTVDRLDFTWTGLMTWNGTTFPDLRIGYQDYAPQIRLHFGTSTSPDNIVKTGTVSFFNSSNGFFDINNIVNGNVASIWVATELGSSDPYVVNNLRVNTLEVRADVTGTLAPVPIPASLFLFGSGLSVLVAGFRRRIFPKPGSEQNDGVTERRTMGSGLAR